MFCTTSFATIQIVGFEPRDAKPRDIDVGITLFGFYSKATIWLLTSIEN